MYTANKKVFACFMLVAFSIQTFAPGVAFALTSGPAQPEMEKFEPAGAGNMVDLFTGDFKYNIPLIDVGGYPLSLSYQSGVGMDDDATWVGAGWTLNPGSLNRTLRGLPDDFSGDVIKKDYTQKPFKKVGGTVTVKPSALAWELGKTSFKLNVYKDNRYGIGASVGASLDMHASLSSRSKLTAGLNLGVNSDVRDGVEIDPSLSLGIDYDEKAEHYSKGLSGGFIYNTRDGLKSTTLGVSYNPGAAPKAKPQNLEMSATHYFGQAYSPTIPVNSSTLNTLFSFDLGPSFFGGYLGLGGSGYVSSETLKDTYTETKAFGYMNYLKARGNLDALLDFNREKDGIFLASSPAIPVPVATQDFFTATSEAGSRQFRPHFAGNYIVYDKKNGSSKIDISLGLTAGVGALFKVGGRFSFTDGYTNTQKWTTNNYYLSRGEPTYSSPQDEPVYMKQVGENTATDEDYTNILGGDKTQRIAISNDALSSQLFSRNNSKIESAFIKPASGSRAKRTEPLSYLNAQQASLFGLDKKINIYSTPQTFVSKDRFRPDSDEDYHKRHHISELTVNDKDGRRMVYGIPVYNVRQEEMTFSCNPPAPVSNPNESARNTGLIAYETDGGAMDDRTNPKHNFGRSELFSREKTPGYATSFLLTGVLSPDYVDRTGDGISDDDMGTAYKFGYTKLENNYLWRSPASRPDKIANYNEGFISDPKDDKASVVFGEREVWYLKFVESKTMIAVFETSSREDGNGAGGFHKGVVFNDMLQKLDRIKLYSKAEYLKNPQTAVPLKTVHFEYAYSLFPNINTNDGVTWINGQQIHYIEPGKLTLTKVYFTFGENTRGRFNAYEFAYDQRKIADGSIANMPEPGVLDNYLLDGYRFQNTDRWGTFKMNFYNPGITTRALNNAEYPYSLQDNVNTSWNERKLMNKFASKWQLNKITTPTGSIINVEYEADDYAYVQDRNAMQMCMVKGAATNDVDGGLINANQLLVELPSETSSVDEFKKRYLKGQTNIFFKMFVDLDNKGHKEFVHGYAEIDESKIKRKDDTHFYIGLKMGNNDPNPVARAAWQMLQTDLKQYAYDNYDNTEVSDGIAAVKSIIQSLGNLSEIVIPFQDRAKRRKFANNFDPAKSMVRLCNPKGEKIGGGARVAKISISDQWKEMTGIEKQKTAVYGQTYSYRTTDKEGDDISSGVASYEPAIGNEENPFHEPLNYTEKVYWSADRYHFIEKPFCESWFPAAQVGYSKVTVTDFGADMDTDAGYTENCFYTAKDFPTLVDYTTLEQKAFENSTVLQLFTAIVVKRVQTSQGFKVELNDMHGKPKSVAAFDKRKNKISSTEYFYNVVNENEEKKALKNIVDILLPSGTVKQQAVIATDTELITDLRESDSQTLGVGIGAYAGSLPALFLPIGYGSYRLTPSKTATTYRSASMVKVIHKYGVVKKIRTMQHGSYSEAENLLWDGETGQVVLTKNQSEFHQNSYAFTFPAWMVQSYEGMGAAYRNLGTMLTSLNYDQNGIISSSLNSFLSPGDELGELNADPTLAKRYWIIHEKIGNQLKYRLIDENGELVQKTGPFIILRSGKRNMLTASAGTVVCMNNPISDNKLKLGVDRRILEAKAIEYSQEWAMPMNNRLAPVVPSYCPMFYDCVYDLLRGLMSGRNTNMPSQPRAIFSIDLSRVNASAYAREHTKLSCLNNFYDGQPASNFDYYVLNPHFRMVGNQVENYLVSGDAAMLGNIKIVFDYVDAEFNNLVNSSLSTNAMLDELDNSMLPGANNKYDLCGGTNGNCSYTFKRRNSINAGQPYINPCNDTDTYFNTTNLIKFHFEFPVTNYTCQSPLDKVVNPYREGLLGNWRPKTNNVYTTNRMQPQSQSNLHGSTDIRNSGYYAYFEPYWNFTADGIVKNIAATKWVVANTSVYYDQKGNEIESKDALGLYGSALYGFGQSSVTAVAANARRNEIAYDGFEDYYYSNTATTDCPLDKHFDWQLSSLSGNWSNNSGSIVTERSHSGRYSYKLNSGWSIHKIAGRAQPHDKVIEQSGGKYILSSNELAAGFGAISGDKEYVLSMWVYDNNPHSDKLHNLNISTNYQSFDVNQSLTVVEGWKKVEIRFSGGSFSLSLNPSGSGVYIDDFRIQPADAQVTTYAYDDRTLRLSAQLDENNFATFYEYDDEGTPVRVKKETEKGIVTLKESRKYLRKK